MNYRITIGFLAAAVVLGALVFGLEKFDIGPIPTAFITGEGYRMIFRLLQHGPVEVELEMTNTIGDGPMDVYNTVGEIRGSEKPDEVVILGAHLDSWDLGTGSTDNGTGSAAVPMRGSTNGTPGWPSVYRNGRRPPSTRATGSSTRSR